LVAAVDWSPLLVQIWFGGTVSVILDGFVQLYRWTFLMPLSIIGFNMAFVCRMGRERILDVNLHVL